MSWLKLLVNYVQLMRVFNSRSRLLVRHDFQAETKDGFCWFDVGPDSNNSQSTAAALLLSSITNKQNDIPLITAVFLFLSLG